MIDRKVAVVLAGGKGTRLAPFTAVFPKPLVPVGEIPIVEILTRQLFRAGFKELVLSVGHLAQLIRAYFHQHPLLAEGLQVSFVEEKEPLGTAGSLALVQDLPESFLVLNGDVLTDLDFASFFETHRASLATLSVATKIRSVQLQLGVIDRIGGVLTGYREKPSHGYEVSMGVYGYTSRALGFIGLRERLDFPDLVLRLLAAGERVQACPCEAEWLDIGNPDDYARAQDLFTARPQQYLGPTA